MRQFSRIARLGAACILAAGVSGVSFGASALMGAAPTTDLQGQMLLAQAAQPKGPAAATPKAAPTANARVRAAQQALMARGHNPGPIDGMMGPRTQQAIRAFQAQRGMAQTGALDNATVAALGIQ